MNEQEKEKIRIEVCSQNCKHIAELTDDDLREKCKDCPLYKL